MIHINFTSKSDIINSVRNGNPQVWSFLPSLFDPPRIVTEKTTRFSLRGTAKKTTIFAEYEMGTVGLEYIPDSDFLAVREFFYSIRREEPFTIDVTEHGADGLGFVSTGFEPVYRVFIPDGELAMPRFSPCEGFMFEFNFRVVSNLSE